MTELTDSDLTAAAAHNRTAVEFHLQGRLKEARREYGVVLALDPPRDPSPEERLRVEQHAPLLYTTPSEPLPLMDVVAVVHPERPLIGYHLFWEDDIDFPDDDEPCDHEEVWVAFEPGAAAVSRVCCWYHSRLLDSAGAVRAANRRGGRPAVYVQWGKHGSLLDGWGDMRAAGLDLMDDMRRTYERLRTEGRRCADFPPARHWPVRFTGTWDDFIDFSCRVDPLDWLRRRERVIVSRWANAAINQHFLLVNFHPKWEWPPEA